MFLKSKKEIVVENSDYIPSGMYMSDLDCKYNTRDKYYITVDGELQHAQRIVAAKQMFNPQQVEDCDPPKSAPVEELPDYLETLVRWAAEDKAAALALRPPTAAERAANVYRAQRRAQTKIYDYIMCNHDLDMFCTWTLNADKLDRYDYATATRKLGQWLDNRVRRNGLKYIIVPELHKDGAVHYHGLINNVVNIVDSGTYCTAAGARPQRAATLKRKGIVLYDCHKVYNLADWYNGYTTAIRTYGERDHVAKYICKYITKSSGKVGGRYYLSGGELAEPVMMYSNTDYDTADGGEYNFGGARMRIAKTGGVGDGGKI